MNELINLGNGQFVKVTMLKGEKGSNIATITKTGTSGLVDTYTVTLTDGSTTTFEVTNGSSIESIEKTGTVGLVDIYTITLTNGETSTFEVTNGNAENLQDAFQASQCAIKAGVSQVTFTNLGDAYITYIPNSECVENAVVVVGFDNGSMYKGTMNYASAIGRWGLSNVELIQGSDVPSTWDVGYGNDSVGTRAFRTGTDFVYSNGIGIALSTSSDVVSYYCVLSSRRVSDNYLQTQINQINSDLSVIGTVTAKNENQANVANNTYVGIVATDDLAVGTYIICGFVTFQSTSTVGSRICRFASSTYNGHDVEVSPNDAGYTQLNICEPIVIGENDTKHITLQAKQKSGSTMNISARIETIRIA